MKQDSKLVVGLDVGDRRSHYCVLDADGTVRERGEFRSAPEAIRTIAAGWRGSVVAFETGTHARWLRRELVECGCEALEANPRQVQLVYGSHTKTDRLDAERLARLARMDPTLLAPVHARDEAAQADLAIVKARDQLVQARAALVNFLRGQVKAFGGRLAGVAVEALPKRAMERVPDALKATLHPILETVDDLTRRIRAYDRRIDRVSEERYPVTEHLQQIRGVGPLTALAFVLVIGDAARFAKSRTVGSYVGLRPRRDQSGSQDVPLGITKAGNSLLRRLLVQCAHYILGPHGEDCDLRRYGERIAARGGKVARKKAVVAVARKLAVLLHRLWVTGEAYEPLRVARLRGEVTKVSA